MHKDIYEELIQYLVSTDVGNFIKLQLISKEFCEITRILYKKFIRNHIYKRGDYICEWEKWHEVEKSDVAEVIKYINIFTHDDASYKLKFPSGYKFWHKYLPLSICIGISTHYYPANDISIRMGIRIIELDIINGRYKWRGKYRPHHTNLINFLRRYLPEVIAALDIT